MPIFFNNGSEKHIIHFKRVTVGQLVHHVVNDRMGLPLKAHLTEIKGALNKCLDTGHIIHALFTVVKLGYYIQLHLGTHFVESAPCVQTQDWKIHKNKAENKEHCVFTTVNFISLTIFTGYL